MPQGQASPIRTALSKTLAKKRIRALAGALEVMQRRRRVDIVALVHSLVRGFGESGAR